MTITTKVELAFGADLTASPGTWTYTDVSLYSLGSVSVSPGRSDEASTTQPAQCSFRLKNTDGRFSPRLPSSPYYPNVRRQTPVRISLNPGTGYVQRFQGSVDVFTPVWPSGNSSYAEVLVTASGSLRRLTQGVAPLRSPLTRWNQKIAVAMWPLDDDSQSTVAGSFTGAGSPLVPSGTVNFGQTSDLGGTSAVVSMATGSAMAGTISGLATNGFVAVDVWVKMFTTSPTNTQTYVCTVGLSGGVPMARLVAINATPGPAGFQFSFTDSTGGLWTVDSGVGTPGSTVNPYDGKWHNVFMRMTQSGPNIAAQLFIDGVMADSRSINGFTLGAPTSAALTNTNSLGDTGTVTFSTLALNTNPAAASSFPAGFGYIGETATTRLTRLCGEETVPITITGTSDIAMGAQLAGDFVTLLRECETADGGILYDGAGPGLSYLARPSRYNQAAALALDCARQQVKLPFVPVEDDQRVRNDWTVNRPGGASSRAINPTHIAANGRYDASATVNVQSDRDLYNQAAHRVLLGTVEEMRVPGLSLQLIDRPELWSEWLATTLGERVTAANLPAQYPAGLLDMVVEGYTETWDSVSWQIALNTSPYAPWRPWTVESPTQGRLVPTSSTLSAQANAGALSLTVATASGPLWVQSALRPTRFPLDIELRGWQLTVTAITGSSSPQTFTLSPSTPVPATIASGTTVNLWRPAALRL